jgi:L-aminopeptidase/D-esterase-like protein
MAENTVLNLILTNARLTKQQAFYVAERSHFGVARRIEPSHTSFDGDVSFILAVPRVEAAIDQVAAMAVHATEDAIINAVKAAKSLCGIKALNETG